MAHTMDDGLGWYGSLGALPDPDTDPQFYDGVAARRLGAAFIDFVMVWGMAFLFVLMTLGIGIFMIGVFVLIADFLHRILTLTSRSATIGMRLMRIELRQRDGRQFDGAAAVTHTVLFYVLGLSMVLQLISMVMMAGTRTGRGLHDLILGTAMINSPE